VRGPDEPEHISLDTLTLDALRERVAQHLQDYAGHRTEPDPRRRAAAWREALDDLTAWLWTEVVGPVVDRLASDTHAVFVAGGLIGLLPLHAAWAPAPERPGGRRYVLDELVVSYSPNARALTASRELAAEITPSRLLAVVDPAPTGLAPLPFGGPEARGVTAATGLGGAALYGPEATPAAFRREAVQADVLLLVCHGRADLAEPLCSALRLAGRPVDLEQLMGMRLHVRLAVLSACETALPGTDLPDEVIGLPTGLLQAGVAGVVASLWAVPDRATAMLMTEFARRWRADWSDPAKALCEAQRWMRDTTNRAKIEHWRRARTEEPTVPADVVDDFVMPLVAAEPDARDHATPAAWAAFTHLGA
jgi:CHAT domain-containing protein